MAKTRQGIMGAFSGAIGPVVGYEWKGRSCMRSRVATSNPRTDCQQRGRTVFGAVSRLWSRMRGAAALPARRSDGRVELRLPQRWTGLEAHLYGFAWDRNLAASPSEYIGTILLS